ncbi:hypothetical protein [Chryseolinea sp. H1M3-3]|uniref:SMI1/KNR4 family protein n=1 Tax=Chryseolinea sp. H1M3-3 TaxID=3034144 RepID=UPI0023EC49C4|nr:hypothetical protein [Chryseolinea sp. H1M3-3]
MQDVIVAIKNLKERYPQLIDTYRPVRSDVFTEFENYLQCEIDSELKELYSFSDGLAFLNYVLVSISNKKIGLLIPPHELEENRLNFMRGLGKRFMVDIHPNKSRKVWFIDEDTSTDIVVANSIHEFFTKFLMKIDVLFTSFDRKKIVAYFEDDGMPDGLARW